MKDKKFSESVEQSIYRAMRNFEHAEAEQRKLDKRELPPCHSNAFLEPARLFFFSHAERQMIYEEMKLAMIGE